MGLNVMCYFFRHGVEGQRLFSNDARESTSLKFLPAVFNGETAVKTRHRAKRRSIKAGHTGVSGVRTTIRVLPMCTGRI